MTAGSARGNNPTPKEEKKMDTRNVTPTPAAPPAPPPPTDLRRRAERLPDEPTESWRSKPGDVLVGIVREINVRATKHDAAVPVLTIENEDAGELVEVWAFHTVLRNELAKKDVQIGDRLAIRRLADSGQGYKRYAVILDRDKPRAFKWGAVPTNAGDVDPTDQHRLLYGDGTADAPPPPEEPPAIADDESESDDLPF